MKGKLALLDVGMAALLTDGRLNDLLTDPPDDDPTPRPEAIYRGIVDRPLKGMGGAIIKLADGQSGFLKDAKGLAPGTIVTVQVSTFTEPHKAAPVSTRILLKSRYCIVTPGAPGINIARSIRDDEERVRLMDIATKAMGSEHHGLIVRSAASAVNDTTLENDIREMLSAANVILSVNDVKAPELLLDAPTSKEMAWREWPDVDRVVEEAGCFAEFDLLDDIENALRPRVPLSIGSLFIEPTAALVAIDVNTGGDNSPAAALKTNLLAAKEISRQLKLRGLGGQITIDFAPSSKKNRIQIENALKSALKRDGIDTIIAGWTPLGNMELQRKRERYPLRKIT